MFWLVVWQLVAAWVGHDFLVARPASVASRLVELVPTADFWSTVWFSFARITLGFALAVAVGVVLAALAAWSRVADALLTPFLTAVRAAPVVSFIILVLLVTDSGKLAAITSFLMVLPVAYVNVLGGIRHRDRALLEMVAVFEVPLLRRVAAVDVPAVLPFFLAACRLGVGLAWKSGVAAEVIGLPDGSIGERLYEAKLFLSSADLFAWTAVIIAVSYGFEKLLVALLGRAERRLAVGRPTPVGAAGGEGAAA